MLQQEGAPTAAGETKIVRDQNGGQSVGRVQALQQGKDDIRGAAVQVAGGLVSQQQFGLGDERARQRDALLLAAGELAGAVLRAVGQFHFAQPAGGHSQCGFAGDAAGEQRHGDVFQRGELRQQVVELPDVADGAVAEVSLLRGRERGELNPGADHLPGGGCVQRGQDVQQGRFARAGFADDGDQIAGGEREVQVAEEFEPAVAGSVGLRQILNAENGDSLLEITSQPVRGTAAGR